MSPLLLGTAVAFLAGVPRLWDLGRTDLNADELTWITRGRQSVASLAAGRIREATAPFGHPGVVPGILIGASHSLLGEGSAKRSLELMDPIAAARLPIALVGTATCILLFAVGRRYFGDASAFWGAVFLALLPPHIALCRIAHIDSTLTLFFALSLLLYLLHTARPSRLLLAASSAAWAFALLSKSPAFILPAILLSWKLCVRIREGRGGAPVASRADAAWLAGGLLLYALLFTKLWYEPARLHWSGYGSRLLPARRAAELFERAASVPVPLALGAAAFLFAAAQAARAAHRRASAAARAVAASSACLAVFAFVLAAAGIFRRPLLNQLNLASKVYAIGEAGHLKYWMGRVVTSPPWWFYPFMLLIAAPPILLAALCVGVFLAARAFIRRGPRWQGLLLCAVAATVFTAVMSLGRKMGFRYLSPVLPFLCLLAGEGLAAAGEFLGRILGPRRAVQAAAGAIVIAALCIPLLNVFPEFDIYYNVLVGGPAGAARIVAVGARTGTREAVEHIRLRAREEDAVYAMGLYSEFRHYWERGRPGPPCDILINRAAPADSDWLVVPLGHRLKNLERETLRLSENLRRVHTVSRCGVDFMEVYRLDAAPRRDDGGHEAERIRASGGATVEDPGASGGEAVEARDKGGNELLTAGPYARYAAGRWRAVFRVKARGIPANGPFGTVSVSGVSAADPLASTELDAASVPRAGAWIDVPVAFETDRPRRLQFRVESRLPAGLRVDSVSVERVKAAPNNPLHFGAARGVYSPRTPETAPR
jgi:4-amino-4-deoxy-L-arabinose transferase-like glycosyltransferase